MNNIIYSILSIFIFSLCVNAQDSLVFDFDNGINVAFKTKTIPSASKDELQKQYQESGSFKPADISSIMRTYTNDDEKIMFAYGMDIKPNDDGKTFTVTFKPRKGFKVQYEDKNKKYDNLEYVDKNLPNYPANIVVNDGDTIVLDVLENPKTGAKIQDLIKITREKKPFENYFSELEDPSDFSMEDVQLQLANYKLYINGKLVERPFSRSSRSRFIGFEFNNYGAFVLSATPEKGYDFKKLGVIDENKLTFTLGGNKFEIVSTVPILGLGKRWNLWVVSLPRAYKDYKIPEQIGFITNSNNKISEFFPSKSSDKSEKKPGIVMQMNNKPNP